MSELEVKKIITKKAEDLEAGLPAVIVKQEDPEEKEIFKPTKLQRKLRADFFARSKGILFDLKTLDIEVIEQYVNSPCLRTAWTNPLFREWFRNETESVSRIRYLIEMQLDNLEEILLNLDGSHSSNTVLAAGKQLMELKRAFESGDGVPDEKKMVSDEVTVKRLAQQMLEAKKQMDKTKDVRKVELPI